MNEEEEKKYRKLLVVQKTILETELKRVRKEIAEIDKNGNYRT